MTKSLTVDYSRDPHFNSLIDDLIGIKQEYMFTEAMARIELKHSIGKFICGSPFYQKHAKGNADVLEVISDACTIGKSDLYHCVQFYEKYPKLSTAVETLQADKKILTWTDIKRQLAGGEQKEKPKSTCKHCPLHCK